MHGGCTSAGPGYQVPCLLPGGVLEPGPGATLTGNQDQVELTTGNTELLCRRRDQLI